MKFSNFFLAISLLLSIPFLSAQTFVGEWTNPSTTSALGSFCCVPTSLTIKKTSTVSWTAIFDFDSFDQKCRLLFSKSSSTNSGQAILYLKLDQSSYGAMIDKLEYFTFRPSSSGSSSSLDVQFTSTTTPFSYLGNYQQQTTQCDFTMMTVKAASAYSSYSITLFLIATIPITGFLYYRKRQNQKADEIAKQKSYNNAVLEYNADKGNAKRNVVPANTGYVAPNTAYAQPAQQYVQQTIPHVAYTQQYVQPYPQAYMQYVPVVQPTYVQPMAMAMPVAMMPNTQVQGYAQTMPKY